MDKEGLSIVFRALSFAAERHRDQRRRNVEASPYINHPIDLASVLINEGDVDDAEIIAAALLHDTIEDTETTEEDLRDRFGEQIANIVLEVSDNQEHAKQVRKQHQVTHAPQLSNQAKLVKLADKISNLRDVASQPPVGWDLARKQEYFDWANDVIRGVRGVNPRLEEVFDAVFAERPAD